MTKQTIEKLNNQIDAALAKLHAATPRVSTRRISRGDYSELLATAFAAVKPGDVTLTFAEWGGYVSGSYGNRAEADRLVVTVDLATNESKVEAWRTTAQSRPYGNGKCMTARICRDGQVNGRSVAL